MIVPPAGVRVLIATRPVDFRRGADGLAAVVQTVLGHDLFSGTIYVFRCKRGQPLTFCIRFAIRDRCLSLASLFRRTLQVSPFRRGKALSCIYTHERPDLCRELPNWMFDESYCVGMTLGAPEISIDGLNELAAVLALLGAHRGRGAHCRPSNEKERDDAEEPGSKSRAARPRSGTSRSSGAGGTKHAGTGRGSGRSSAGQP